MESDLIHDFTVVPFSVNLDSAVCLAAVLCTFLNFKHSRNPRPLVHSTSFRPVVQTPFASVLLDVQSKAVASCVFRELSVLLGFYGTVESV